MTDEHDSATSRAAAWDIAQLDGRRAASDRPYLEFLRVADLSAGMYVLEAGAMDRQVPHTEDEMYAVIGGSGRLRMGADDVAVGPGTIAFVAAGLEHRFHDIHDRLTILVVFGPAEGSRASSA
jgi:mannose-6-phosphate isomerase-like protein (cupin superfamily)